MRLKNIAENQFSELHLPTVQEIAYNREKEADLVVIIITNKDRTKIVLKEREDKSVAIPSGKGVLGDRRFHGNIRLAAIAEALHTIGRQDMEYIFGEKDIKLIGVYQSTDQGSIIPLYEMILPEQIPFGPSNDNKVHDIRIAKWVSLSQSPTNLFAEQSRLLEIWKQKRQIL